MKNSVIIFLFLFVIVGSCAWSAAQEKKNPVAVLENKSYQIGSIIDGTVVTHDFILQNEGNVDLLIENIKAG